jgi:hypothetical protein
MPVARRDTISVGVLTSSLRISRARWASMVRGADARRARDLLARQALDEQLRGLALARGQRAHRALGRDVLEHPHAAAERVRAVERAARDVAPEQAPAAVPHDAFVGVAAGLAHHLAAARADVLVLRRARYSSCVVRPVRSSAV